MKYFLLLLSSLACFALSSQAQHPRSISLRTGIMMDNYQSLAGRLFLEYTTELSPKWSYGINLEQTRHIMSVGQDFARYAPTNINSACVNYYFRINLINKSVYWTAGIGAGILHLHWDGHDKLGLVGNASWLLNIRLSDKIHLEVPPFLILPPFLASRFYYSSIDVGDGAQYFGGTVPLGVKLSL